MDSIFSNLEVLNDLQKVANRLHFYREILVNMPRLKVVVFVVVRSQGAPIRFERVFVSVIIVE